MNKLLLILTIVSLSFTSYAQKTKKVTVKNDYPAYKEIYYVLKSNNAIKQGTYKKYARRHLLEEGTYINNKRTGIWNYFDYNGDLAHKVDISSGKLLFDKYSEQHTDFDKEKYSRPVILLGGLNSLYLKFALTLRYPPEARIKGIQGKVYVKMIFDTEGNIKEFNVVEGLGYGLDEEALRALNLITFDALPALDTEGNPTNGEIILPITFKLG